MRSKNTFYSIFWLAGCLFVLGYLCINKMIDLDPKYIICFSASAFGVSIAAFLSQLIEEFNVSRIVRLLLDMLTYLFMGMSMFALVVFPFVIKNIDYVPVSNCLTLWSLALIFLSTVLKEIKYSIANRKKAAEQRTEAQANAGSVQETQA